MKYIKDTTQTLKEQYDGDIPDSVEKLCKLRGVGPKMAHICMKVAWNKVTGIGNKTININQNYININIIFILISDITETLFCLVC